jgi:hypothetical protein
VEALLVDQPTFSPFGSSLAGKKVFASVVRRGQVERALRQDLATDDMPA